MALSPSDWKAPSGLSAPVQSCEQKLGEKDMGKYDDLILRNPKINSRTSSAKFARNACEFF